MALGVVGLAVAAWMVVTYDSGADDEATGPTTTVCSTNLTCTPECQDLYFAVADVIRDPDHKRAEYEAAYQVGVERCGWATLEEMRQST